ncbi:MAG: HAMP domain-containing sensor histidine kinase [Myxococcota bacterium]
MRRRLNIIFALIVLFPLGTLAFLGQKIARDERVVLEQRLHALHEDRLRDLSGTIGRTMGELERELSKQLESSGRDDESLRELVRRAPLAVTAFWVSSTGQLMFPREGEVLSAGEQAFIQRTASIWKGQAMLYDPPRREEDAAKKVALPSLSRRDNVPTLAVHREQGWISWYWEEGLHLLFWRRSADGDVLGVEVDRVALLSRIVGELPSLDLEDGQIVLQDSKGDSILEWGQNTEATPEPLDVETVPSQAVQQQALPPLPLAKKRVAEVRVALAYPLDAYELGYHVPRANLLARSTALTTGASLLAVVGVVLGLAYYFFREQSREMREATNRVSFVTQVSHELKTPLTNIRLYAELLDENLDPEDAGAKKHLGVIVSESQRLSRLINNILTFSKRQNDRLILRRAEIDLPKLVEGVLAQFSPSFAAKGLTASVRGTAPGKIEADPDAIGQILGNLLSNVEKYAAQGKSVELELAQDGAGTRLAVRDFGLGIPASQRDKVFDPFYRVSDKLSDGATGTGIGLTIARELARLHGGDLVLEPADPGTRFVLSLPRSQGASS